MFNRHELSSNTTGDIVLDSPWNNSVVVRAVFGTIVVLDLGSQSTVFNTVIVIVKKSGYLYFSSYILDDSKVWNGFSSCIESSKSSARLLIVSILANSLSFGIAVVALMVS